MAGAATAYDITILGGGTMHAPAVGRALSELALTGRYQSIDLTRLEIARIHNNQPLPEIGIK